MHPDVIELEILLLPVQIITPWQEIRLALDSHFTHGHFVELWEAAVFVENEQHHSEVCAMDYDSWAKDVRLNPFVQPMT